MFNVTSAANDGAVRVTERILSDANERGERFVVAYAGQQMSLSEAHRQGIPMDKLEAVGLAGRLALAGARGEDVDIDAAAATLVDDGRLPSADPLAAPAVSSYPEHRGGNWWTLSNGERFQGNRASAMEAEAQLQAAADDDALTDEERAALAALTDEERAALAALTDEERAALAGAAAGGDHPGGS